MRQEPLLSVLPAITPMTDSKIPQTADGQIIYPGMPGFICEPYSIEEFRKATIYCVLRHGNHYCCVLDEDRYFDGEYWNDGNTEALNRVFADRDQCLIAVRKLVED